MNERENRKYHQALKAQMEAETDDRIELRWSPIILLVAAVCALAASGIYSVVGLIRLVI